MTFRPLLISLAFALGGAPCAWTLESAPVTTPHAEVRLVSEVDALEPGKPFRLGLSFKLAKGWHIYWSNPGAAGEPPTLDLKIPEGAKNSGFAFPAPVRVAEGPAMSYAYLDEVLLPLTVETPTGLKAFPIEAKAGWLICEKICVPEEGSFKLNLPVGNSTKSSSAPLFERADRRMPATSPFKADISADAMLTIAGDGLFGQPVADAWFLPAAWGAIDDAAPQTLSLSDGKLSLALKKGETFDPNANFAGLLVVKNPSGEERFYDIATKPEASTSTAPAARSVVTTAKPAPSTADLSLAAMLGFAFLGGLILNLMPCVFPILAMKAVGIARLSGHARQQVRGHALSYTLGVLVAFGALAGLLIALRAAGGAAGWGFQFQSPLFVAGIAWLLFAVGLNLSGVFEIGGGFTGAGQQLASRGGHAGSFFTGLLAVLVATPCTAPFMGAAIAGAAVAPAPVMILVFLVMGLGLAAPYALLGLLPGLANLLPRPGAWMLILRQVLAFPMYGAAAWLIWVLSQQAGSDGVFAALVGAVLIGFAAWIYGATQSGSTPGIWIGRVLAAASVIAATAFLLSTVLTFPAGGTAARDASNITPFTVDLLAKLRAEGRPVFVNMTAAWCVTCLVNEKVALSSDKVERAFAKRNVAYLKGDWTRPDPAITAFLREHGRDGVPLYVLYPPKGQSPIVLPQILTADMVLEQLNRSGS